ncbi:MAG: T9SS type A sorting domain-containing protein [Ignavibacteriae bacterium]|nr:T9SS type A sorting domain-containing protein [Ignavibacteriota bacterium]
MKCASYVIIVALLFFSSTECIAKEHALGRTTALSSISRFPFQDSARTIPEAVPVVMSGETVMFFWAESTVVRSAKSSDGGVTWNSPTNVATAQTPVQYLSAIRSSTGRVIIVWRDTTGVVETYSDNGQTWSAPFVIATTVTNLLLSQTTDGKLWLSYRWILGGVVRLITSTDNGATWTAPLSMPSYVKNQLSIVSGLGSAIVGFFISAANKLERVVSLNGGSTWSSASPILSGGGSEEMPRARNLSVGTIIVVYQSGRVDSTPLPYTTYDVMYVASSDGGATWSSAQNFTRYLGIDQLRGIDLMNGKPFVLFGSDRFFPARITSSQLPRQLWYGTIGGTPDSLAPPVFLGWSVSPQITNFPAIIRVYTDDEVGMLAVKVRYAFNGILQPELSLFDDGMHNDLFAGDNVFGNDLPPLPEGTIDFWCDITDFTGVSLRNNQVVVFIRAPQDAPGAQGDSMKVSMNNVGVFGRIVHNWPSPRPFFVGMQYPARTDLEHLYSGGIWIGGMIDTLSGRWPLVSTVSEYDPYITGELSSAGGSADTVWKTKGRNSPKPSGWDGYWGNSIAFRSPGDQNFFCTYSDYFYRPSSHIPLGVKVIQSSFTWNGSTLPGVQILDYRIANNSQRTINSAYVAFFADADVGPNTYAGFYGRNYTEFFPAYRAAIAHNSVDPGSTPMGVSILGSVPDSLRITYKWYPGLQSPQTDSMRYQLMSDGVVQPTGFPAVDDIRFLVSVGPFTIRPYTSSNPDTLRIGFAVLSAMNIPQLLDRAGQAQDVYQRVIVRGEPIEPPVPPSIPTQFNLSQNYPNPFNSSTKIEYQIPRTSHVELRVFDILGRHVATLVNEAKTPGTYEAIFDARQMASGVYFYSLSADGFASSRKALLIR